MAMLSQPAFGPKLSIGLILVGALMDVWTLVWRYTLGPDTLGDSQRFWYLGLLLTGATLLLVGFFLGQIGRAARKAELPPPEATAAEATIQNTAAQNPQPVVAAPTAAVPQQVAMTPVQPVAPAAAPRPVSTVTQ